MTGARERTRRNLVHAARSGSRWLAAPALRAYRRAHDLSLDNLEQLSGWSSSLLAYMETGQRWNWAAWSDVLEALEVER